MGWLDKWMIFGDRKWKWRCGCEMMSGSNVLGDSVLVLKLCPRHAGKDRRVELNRPGQVELYGLRLDEAEFEKG